MYSSKERLIELIISKRNETDQESTDTQPDSRPLSGAALSLSRGPPPPPGETDMRKTRAAAIHPAISAEQKPINIIAYAEHPLMADVVLIRVCFT